MKKVMTIFGVILFASVILIGCGGTSSKEPALENEKQVEKSEQITTKAEEKSPKLNNIYTYKDMRCNDAACPCNDCYYEFIGDDGKELIINEIDEENKSIKLYTTIEHNDEGGWIEVIPNKKYVNKKFQISYSVTICKCEDVEPNNDYKKLTSIKIIE